MGELALWEPPPDESHQFSKFVALLDQFYPRTWRSWEINDISYEELFGEKISSDEECRLRFAVPTIELAHVFSEEKPKSLSERKYKAIKRTLINWPLARATIYVPFATMKLIHPIDAFSGFAELLPKLKEKFISRSEASAALKRNADAGSTSSSSTRKRSHSPDINPQNAKATKTDTMADYMRQQNEILAKLCSLMGNQTAAPSALREESGCESHDEDNNWFSSPSETQSPPEIPPSEPATAESITLFDFAPDTKESEAKIGKADDALVAQGSRCQRLGGDQWQNVRYGEVQKQFQASPLFTSLKVNSSLATVTPPWQMTTALEKMDLCLGAITHGLLQQRKVFTDIYDAASLQIKQEISKNFLATESNFRRTSDALLQYTCGKRQEIIQQRRSLYKPPNKTLNELLHSIPPTNTHLFAEPQLGDLIKEQGGINRFFPGRFNHKQRPNLKTAGSRQEVTRSRPAENPTRRPIFRHPDRLPTRVQQPSGRRQYTAPGKTKKRYDAKKF